MGQRNGMSAFLIISFCCKRSTHHGAEERDVRVLVAQHRDRLVAPRASHIGDGIAAATQHHDRHIRKLRAQPPPRRRVPDRRQIELANLVRRDRVGAGLQHDDLRRKAQHHLLHDWDEHGLEEHLVWQAVVQWHVDGVALHARANGVSLTLSAACATEGRVQLGRATACALKTTALLVAGSAGLQTALTIRFSSRGRHAVARSSRGPARQARARSKQCSRQAVCPGATPPGAAHSAPCLCRALMSLFLVGARTEGNTGWNLCSLMKCALVFCDHILAL